MSEKVEEGVVDLSDQEETPEGEVEEEEENSSQVEEQEEELEEKLEENPEDYQEEVQDEGQEESEIDPKLTNIFKKFGNDPVKLAKAYSELERKQSTQKPKEETQQEDNLLDQDFDPMGNMQIEGPTLDQFFSQPREDMQDILTPGTKANADYLKAQQNSVTLTAMQMAQQMVAAERLNKEKEEIKRKFPQFKGEYPKFLNFLKSKQGFGLDDTFEMYLRKTGKLKGSQPNIQKKPDSHYPKPHKTATILNSPSAKNAIGGTSVQKELRAIFGD